MTRIKIKQLSWGDWNVEHMRVKHNVTVVQVEEAVQNPITHKRGYQGRYIILGRSGSRILAVIVNPEGRQKYFLVTARDADKDERRRVYEKEKARKNSQI